MSDAKPHTNQSAARLRVVSQVGDIYAAQSSDGQRIKIGFSTQLGDRLKALNYEFPQSAPFTFLGSTKSKYRVEQQIHRALQPFHHIHVNAGKELYPAAPTVRLVVSRLIVSRDHLDWIELDDMLALTRWCREQAKQDQNKAVAELVYAPIFAKRREAHERWMEQLMARIAARRAAAA